MLAPKLIWEWRARENLSQREAAKKLGVTQAAVSAYEAGASVASAPVATRIAERTGGAVPVKAWTFTATDLRSWLRERRQLEKRTGTDG